MLKDERFLWTELRLSLRMGSDLSETEFSYMKRLAAMIGTLTAFPAVAHEAGPIVHSHPHGIETAVALAAVAFLTFAAWKVRR